LLQIFLALCANEGQFSIKAVLFERIHMQNQILEVTAQNNSVLSALANTASTAKNNPIVQRAIERVRARRDNNVHASHTTKHTSHSSHSKGNPFAWPGPPR
jgi:hypothetical protein